MYSMTVENTNDHNHDHVRNFLGCVKDRSNPISDIEIGHRSTTTCLLANISFLTGQKLEWDGEREQVSNHSEANAMLEREYRPPWELTV
jgi:hypothetical protein